LLLIDYSLPENDWFIYDLGDNLIFLKRPFDNLDFQYKSISCL